MTEPNFRDLATKALYYLDRMPLASSYPLAREIRAALATSPPEPPEQKSSIDELIAGCKPLDPEMAEALTTEARWRLFGEDGSATPPPEAPIDVTLEPSFSQRQQLLQGLSHCFSNTSAHDYLKVWIRDYTRAALERWGQP